MPKLSIHDAVRYLLPCMVLFFYVGMFDPGVVEAGVRRFSTIGLTGIALASGVIAYFVYRPLIFETVLIRLQDVFRIPPSHSYRTFLKTRYGISTRQASGLMDQIIDDHLGDRYLKHISTSAIPVESAGIHLGYVSGLLATPFLVLSVGEGMVEQMWLFGLLAAVLLPASFLNQRRFEDMEMRFIRSLDPKDLDASARRFLGMDWTAEVEATRSPEVSASTHDLSGSDQSPMAGPSK